MSILEIRNLHVEVEGQEILKGLDLVVEAGEVHAIMGPNGSGKSTLASALAGREEYEITEGTIRFKGEDLTEKAPEERAQAGVFMAFQYPVVIPGVSNTYFLKAALNSIRKARGEQELDAMEFLSLVRERVKLVELDDKLINRPVNDGFLRRREETQRDLPPFCLGADLGNPGLRPTLASTSMRCES